MSYTDELIRDGVTALWGWLDKPENEDIRRAFAIHDQSWDTFDTPPEDDYYGAMLTVNRVYTLSPEQSVRWRTFIHDIDQGRWTGSMYFRILALARMPFIRRSHRAGGGGAGGGTVSL